MVPELIAHHVLKPRAAKANRSRSTIPIKVCAGCGEDIRRNRNAVRANARGRVAVYHRRCLLAVMLTVSPLA